MQNKEQRGICSGFIGQATPLRRCLPPAAKKATIAADYAAIAVRSPFPEYRRRVLELLLQHPHDALHGREIARRTGLSAGTLNRELALLARAGVLRREEQGNQHLYSLDAACVIYEELASILRKTFRRRTQPHGRTGAARNARGVRRSTPDWMFQSESWRRSAASTGSASSAFSARRRGARPAATATWTSWSSSSRTRRRRFGIFQRCRRPSPLVRRAARRPGAARGACELVPPQVDPARPEDTVWRLRSATRRDLADMLSAGKG